MVLYFQTNWPNVFLLHVWICCCGNQRLPWSRKWRVDQSGFAILCFRLAFGHIWVVARSSHNQGRVWFKISADCQDDGRGAASGEDDLRPPDGGQRQDWFHACSQKHGQGLWLLEVVAGAARKNHYTNDTVQTDRASVSGAAPGFYQKNLNLYLFTGVYPWLLDVTV